jgi:hypothetical protein
MRGQAAVSSDHAERSAKLTVDPSQTNPEIAACAN